MIRLLLLLALLWTAPAFAQTPSPYPYTQPPTTHPEVFRQLAGDIFSEVGKVLMGQNFGRGRAFSLTRTFRLSPIGVKGSDGLEKTVQEKIVVDSKADAATFDTDARAKLPALVTKLAAKIQPYTVIGSLPHTQGKMTDPVSQTPDSLLLLEDIRAGFLMRVRYTRGRWTGDHTVYAEVLVGRGVTP